VTSGGNRPASPARAAVLAGLLAAFVASVDFVRAVRIGVLLDPEPSWALPRLLLGLGVITMTAAAAGIAATLVWVSARRLGFEAQPVPLAFRDGVLGFLAVAAVAVGVFLRFVDLERRPSWLFVDDLSLITPALALEGSFRDFADSIRPVPFGVPDVYGTVGVLYLEGFRETLRLFGMTVFGVRFLSALAGALSLVTAARLARALLPRGGGTLTALTLAGLRWHLILSRWGWNMIVLAPIVDVAALLLLRARGRRSLPLALAAGLVAGLGAHIYLAAWIAGVALLGLAFWPGADAAISGSVRRRLALLFAVGWVVATAPLFLFREGRTGPYFARAGDHNVLLEIHRARSVLPALDAAADGLLGPWITADPSDRNDLPGRSRLGWLLGIPVLAAFLHAILVPRREFSGFLLTHAAAAVAATVAGGEALTPNGARFGYLTTCAAVAAAGGVLLLLNFVPPSQRRLAAIAAVGLVAICGAVGARDALIRWPEAQSTFRGFFGQDTLFGQGMARWSTYGTVFLSPGLAHSPIEVEAIHRYRLDPDGWQYDAVAAARGTRTFRLVSPMSARAAGERFVGRISDPWGEPWADVVGRKNSR
jgi:hypothetical protein